MIPYVREAMGAAVGASLMLIAAVVFYEGAPIGPLRMIPFLGPLLEDVTDGRVDRARKEGAARERIAWEEARRRLLAEQEEERRKAQQRINEAELVYLDSRTEDALRIAALEEQIAQEALANETDDEARACPARPAISGGLSRSLDKIGR
jgi:hypothetical protein